MTRTMKRGMCRGSCDDDGGGGGSASGGGVVCTIR